MKQYEYLVVEIDTINSSDSQTIRYKQQRTGEGGYASPDTNDLGRGGWELIQFLNHPTTQAPVGVFKREIPS